MGKIYKVGGALPSPDDERDYKLDSLIMKTVLLPNKYTVEIPAIIADQKNTGCCVAATLAQIKHCQEFKEINDSEMFSAAYIYSNRNDNDYCGSGMYPREALQHLVESGTCHNKDFPDYNICEFEEMKERYIQKKSKLDRLAKPYRASSYYRLSDIEDIKMALYTSNTYVQICYPIYKSFYMPDENGFINYESNILLRGKNYGGHSVTVCAYDDDRKALGIINSWGIDYGVGIKGISDGGCVWVSYDYPFTEAWACIDATTQKELIQEYQ